MNNIGALRFPVSIVEWKQLIDKGAFDVAVMPNIPTRKSFKKMYLRRSSFCIVFCADYFWWKTAFFASLARYRGRHSAILTSNAEISHLLG